MGLKRKYSDMADVDPPPHQPPSAAVAAEDDEEEDHVPPDAMRRRRLAVALRSYYLSTASSEESDESDMEEEVVTAMQTETRNDVPNMLKVVTDLLSDLDEADELTIHIRCREAQELCIHIFNSPENSLDQRSEALSLWVLSLLHLAKNSADDMAAEYATECIARSIQLSEMRNGALSAADLFNWAEASFVVASVKSEFRFYEDAITRFKLAVARNPTDMDARTTAVAVVMGGAVDCAPDSPSKTAIIRVACTLCEAGFGYSACDDARGYWLNQWGMCLSKLATTSADEAESAAAFAVAENKFDESIRLKPDLADEVTYHWAVLLNLQAGATKCPERALSYQTSAEEKVRDLFSKLPNDMSLANLLGVCLMARALLLKKLDRDGDAVVREARRVLTAAHRRQPGEATYNLACWSSLFSGEDECRRWMELAHSEGVLPRRAHLERDTDLDNVRGTEWFRTILADMPDD